MQWACAGERGPRDHGDCPAETETATRMQQAKTMKLINNIAEDVHWPKSRCENGSGRERKMKTERKEEDKKKSTTTHFALARRFVKA